MCILQQEQKNGTHAQSLKLTGMFKLVTFVAHTMKPHFIYLLFKLCQSLISMNADLLVSWSGEYDPYSADQHKVYFDSKLLPATFDELSLYSKRFRV